MTIGKAGLLWLAAVMVLITLQIDPGACRVESTEWRGDAAHATNLFLGYIAISLTTYFLGIKISKRS
tara:strand:- start:258 stop:458 length:201 start_codon:yes stop_codon:yes gene_type:complete